MAVETHQTTVARRVVRNGIGLHCGHEVEIALSPGATDTGIVFVVAARDRAGVVEIPAQPDAVLSSSRATSLTDGAGTTISTVEHLLATLYALRIDNVRIEVVGGEIPILDGSALPFIDWIRSAGRVTQKESRIEFEITRPFGISDGERSIRVVPHPTLSISYAIDFDHPAIGRQCFELSRVESADFECEIAGARTFGFEHEVEALRAAGLARGGSIENVLVLNDHEVVNASGLRWPDEFVRHKIIDLLGDLSLIGRRMKCHIRVECGGHGLHHRLVQRMLSEEALLKRVVAG